MIKAELVECIAQNQKHLTISETKLIVDTILSAITNAVVNGDRVELRGFGVFGSKKRNQRLGRNPMTGEDVFVPQKTVPYFKPGKRLRNNINATNTHNKEKQNAQD